jgi:hypothetical protein
VSKTPLALTSTFGDRNKVYAPGRGATHPEQAIEQYHIYPKL